MVEPGGDTANLDGLDVEIVSGDLRDPVAVDRAVAGCAIVFHVAALYRFWSPDPAAFYDINVTGTRHVLDAARSHGVTRVVYTSTVGTLGLNGATIDAPVDERVLRPRRPPLRPVQAVEVRGRARGAARRGRGPAGRPRPAHHPGRAPRPGADADRAHRPRVPRRPHPRIRGHHPQHRGRRGRGRRSPAGRRAGPVGRSYILGGENLALRDVLATLAAVTGLPAPTRRFPAALALAAGHVSGSRRGPPAAARALRPLGGGADVHHPDVLRRHAGPARSWGTRRARPTEALERAARWFVESGAVRPERVDRCTWPGS